MISRNLTQFGLGIDAGGTATRWALVSKNQTNEQCELVSQGQVIGLTGLLMSTEDGQAQLADAIRQIAHNAWNGDAAIRNNVQVFAGLTGLPDNTGQLHKHCASAFNVAPSRITLVSDIELTHRAHFEPGDGYIVYAGTGSYSSFIDIQRGLHRRGAHGGILDDGGSGFWIAREALKQVWRREDEQSGQWRQSPMAEALFAQLGGSDWAHTRQFVYGQSNAQMRGRMGIMATAVGATADRDTSAKNILVAAGKELARLGNILCDQFGNRPIQFAGRVFDLHPIIFETARATITKENHHIIQLSSTRSLAKIAAQIAVGHPT